MILNLETATTNCSVGLASDGEPLAIKEHSTPRYSHSEQLHVFIQDVLRQANVNLYQLDAIAVSKGPGSYTGLRIGVSAAKGLCFALDIPLIAIGTLESMAHQAVSKNVDFVIPVLDARRMEVYSEVYDKNLLKVRETRAEIIDSNSFEKYSSQGKVLVVGSGAKKCVEVLEGQNFLFEPAVVPSAEQMSLLSHKSFTNSEFEDVAYFEPFYLKDFIAIKSKS